MIMRRSWCQVLHEHMNRPCALACHFHLCSNARPDPKHSAPEGGYVAYNLETGTITQGETVEEALSNLSEATELYPEESPISIIGRSLPTSFQVPAYA